MRMPGSISVARSVFRPAVPVTRPGLAPRRLVVKVANVASVSPPPMPSKQRKDLSAPPPFTLQDLRNAIPDHCFVRDTARSFSHLIKDVICVVGLALIAYDINQWWAWPLYWFAQGTMFWALFCVGHDCGHQSFSNDRKMNDFVGNVVHAAIMVPYHGWRISHRTHHANHGHVENDESWYPTTKSNYEEMDIWARLGRLSLPWAMLAYPFYLWKRSPGKEGSHYDPSCDLFKPSEGKLVITSNTFMVGMLAILGAFTFKLGIPAMFNLYFMPYVLFVVWLDVVTYLHHHGPHDETEQMPWYRGEEWSYLRGGLTCLDRDYGVFNEIHHDIGTHVVHHLFPAIPHYHLNEATEAIKPVMGEYYREPEPSPGPLPFHLLAPLMRSFSTDHYVEDEGDIVYYKKDPNFGRWAS